MSAILFGLLSSTSWGGGDFAGGLASRRLGALRAVFFGELVGLLPLLAALVWVKETFPAGITPWLAFVAGGIGSLGLVVLYHSVAIGKMSISMPVSALLAAALPVVVSAFVEGFPGPLQFAGFGLALAAIWLVSQDAHDTREHLERLSELRLPLFAGLCFGVYFILIHDASQQSALWPMIFSRLGGILLLLGTLLARRESFSLPVSALPLVSLNAVLDVGGNFFYILAGQAGRMDVAVVLSSLYPGVTVILAGLILKEHISPSQRVGILLALVAIALMTV